MSGMNRPGEADGVTPEVCGPAPPTVSPSAVGHMGYPIPPRMSFDPSLMRHEDERHTTGPPGTRIVTDPIKEERRAACRCVTRALRARRPGRSGCAGLVAVPARCRRVPGHRLRVRRDAAEACASTGPRPGCRGARHRYQRPVRLARARAGALGAHRRPLAGRRSAPPRHGTDRAGAVYEQLGPAIRRAVHERPQPLAISAPVTEQLPPVSDAPVTRVADAPPARAASRISIATVALVAVLMLTMGAAFALESLHVRLPWVAPRTGDAAAPRTTGPNVLRPTPVADRPSHGPAPTEEGSCPRTRNGIRGDPNTHASTRAAASHARTCPTGGDPGNEPQHPGKADRANKNDQPGSRSIDPGKDDHPNGRPDGVGSGGSSHGSGGKPKDEPGNTQPGPSKPPSDTGHGPR